MLAVDDGSTDATPVLLQRYRHDVAAAARRPAAGQRRAPGGDLGRPGHARGDYVATLDADLQDPPEVIAEMLAAARRDGVDVVYGVRADRSTDSAFKRGSARAFYRLIRRLSRHHRARPTPATSG